MKQKPDNQKNAPTMLFREATIDAASMKDGSREVELAFSSEQPVQRYDWRDGKDYMEVLSHAATDVDLSRLNNSHPLLLNHDTEKQIGVVKSASIGEDKKARATVKFSRSALGTEVLQDVQDGIRTLVSVGYRVGREVSREQRDGMEYRTFVWTPHEVSIVPIPADTSVGVGRAESEPTNNEPAAPAAEPTAASAAVINEPLNNTKNMPDNTPAAAPVPAANNDKRTNEILAIAEKYDAFKDARAFIADNKTAEDFMRHILETKFAAKPVITDGNIGMNQKEQRDYSLVKAIRALTSGKWDGAELEREASNAMAKMLGRETSGFFIPTEIQNGKRDLAAGTNNLGKYTVQTNVLGSSLIELLRNATVTKELGARQLSGLTGNVAIPSQAGGATAYWVAENGQTTGSNLTFGQVALTPKRLSAVSALSKQLIAQSSVDVEGLVRMDFARIMAIALDAAALTGDGQSNNPTGILSTGSIGSITFGGAATYQDFVDMESSLATANALLGSPAFVVDAATRAKLRILPQIGSTYPTWVWEKPVASGIAGEGSILGYRAVSTQQLVDSHKVIFGNFNDLIIADWVGMDVTVDPYTLADKNQIKITVNGLFDVGVRHVGSFCASSDSGAQ